MYKLEKKQKGLPLPKSPRPNFAPSPAPKAFQVWGWLELFLGAAPGCGPVLGLSSKARGAQLAGVAGRGRPGPSLQARAIGGAGDFPGPAFDAREGPVEREDCQAPHQGRGRKTAGASEAKVGRGGARGTALPLSRQDMSLVGSGRVIFTASRIELVADTVRSEGVK